MEISRSGEVDCFQVGVLTPYLACNNAAGTIVGSCTFSVINNGYSLDLTDSSGSSWLGGGAMAWALIHQ